MKSANALRRRLITIPGYIIKGCRTPRVPMPGGILGGCLALMADIDRFSAAVGRRRKPLLGGFADKVAAIIVAEANAAAKERWLLCRRGRSGI
jgi:hypothetical protein